VSNESLLSVYVAHREALVLYASRILGDAGRAEEVVQEAYFRFRTAASERLVEEPVRYLYRIVRNLALDGQRRRRLEGQYFPTQPETAPDPADDRPSPEDEAIARQQLRQVIAALDTLPERTRIALEMHRFGGCTLKEIARHLGISVSMAQVLVIDGVKRCQRALSGPEDRGNRD